MELHHLAEYPSAQLRVYFLTSPKVAPSARRARNRRLQQHHRCRRFPEDVAACSDRIIKRIEDVLGVSLFERTTGRVQLTPAGREFVAVAERMLPRLIH
jgi:hypothetical protein